MDLNREVWRLSFLIHRQCNLHCSYCYVQQNKKNISLDLFKENLNLFLNTKGNFKEINILGGEPTLRIDFLEKITRIMEEGRRKILKYENKIISHTISTNLTFLDNRIISIFRNFDFIAISFDGEKLSHNLSRRFTINQGSFDVVSYNINLLLKDSNINRKLVITKVVSPHNVKNLLRDIKFLSHFEIPIFINIAVGIEGWNRENIIILNKQFKLLYNYLLELPRNKIKRYFKTLFRIPIPYCPYSNLVLNPEGRIYNCEILASADFKRFLISNKDNDLECKYTLRDEKCSKEICLKCENFCQKYSFHNKKTITNNYLSLIKKVNTLILKKYIAEQNIRIHSNFLIKCNIDKKNIEYALLRLDNFLLTLMGFFSLHSSRPFIPLNIFFYKVLNKEIKTHIQDLIQKKGLYNFLNLKLSSIAYLSQNRDLSEVLKPQFRSLIIDLETNNVFIYKRKKLQNNNIEKKYLLENLTTKDNLIGNLYQGISVLDF